MENLLANLSSSVLSEILVALVPVLIVVVAIKLFWYPFCQKLASQILYRRQNGIDSIRNLDWRQFELFLGEFFRRDGFHVAQTGLGGADGGVDLVLTRDNERAVVQCKQWKTWKVGPAPIRELYGVMTAANAQRAFFVTSGHFTQAARNFADGKPLELIDGEQLASFFRSQNPEAAGKSPLLSTLASFFGIKQPEVITWPVPSAEVQADSPSCPQCSSPMTLRTAKKGIHAGRQFWGCQRYPQCRGIVNLPAET